MEGVCASCTVTCSPLPARKFTVTVAALLAVPWEFVAAYWNVIEPAAVAPGRATVNPPSGFTPTVAPVGVPTNAAVSGCPCGSMTYPRRPGAFTLMSEATLLVYVALDATGTPPRQLSAALQGASVTVAWRLVFAGLSLP